MAETSLPVTAVDAPSSWDIEEGPPKSGVGSNFHPAVLVSLTAPKPLVKHFRGRHFIGGRYVPRPASPLVVLFALTVRARFVAPAIAKKYDFDVPAYEGLDQVVEVGPEGLKL
jgi:NAD(P)H-hydrate epimerase